jgi:hypothetical protein
LVTPARHGLDAAIPVRSLIEDAAKRRYLHRQVSFLDDGARPYRGHELVFGDEVSILPDQHAQNVERARTNADRVALPVIGAAK